MNTTSEHTATPTSRCIDCGHPTHCSMPHGSGHDHSPEALACSAAALAAG
jgi:hypothetical protein